MWNIKQQPQNDLSKVWDFFMIIDENNIQEFFLLLFKLSTAGKKNISPWLTSMIKYTCEWKTSMFFDYQTYATKAIFYVKSLGK